MERALKGRQAERERGHLEQRGPGGWPAGRRPRFHPQPGAGGEGEEEELPDRQRPGGEAQPWRLREQPGQG